MPLRIFVHEGRVFIQWDQAGSVQSIGISGDLAEQLLLPPKSAQVFSAVEVSEREELLWEFDEAIDKLRRVHRSLEAL